MKVLLVNPIRRGGDSYCTPPLHLMYIAQAVRAAGHEAQIFDASFMLHNDMKITPGKNYQQELIDKIIATECDILGIGSIVSSYGFSQQLVEKVKQAKNIPVIIGGGLGTPILELWESQTKLDFLVAGQGEQVIQRFLEAYPDKEKLRQIPGLYYREDGKFVKNKPRLDKDLDHALFPDWEDVDREAFISIMRKWINATLPEELRLSAEDRVLPIVMTRGCPYDCTFCYHFDRTHKKHSIEYIINYLVHLKEKYGINTLQTWDDLIIADREWFMKLCDELAARDLGFKIFSSGGKPNLISKEMLAKMKKAGFIRISYGVESGSPKMLEVMKKRVTAEQNRAAIEMTREAGIFVHLNMVLGMPGESKQTLNETWRFLNDLKLSPKHVSFAFATAYPGTDLFDHLVKAHNVVDVKAYLDKVTGVSHYQYNFTGLSRYTLLGYPAKTLLKLRINELKREKKYLEYFKQSVVGRPSVFLKSFLKTYLPESSVVYINKLRFARRLSS